MTPIRPFIEPEVQMKSFSNFTFVLLPLLSISCSSSSSSRDEYDQQHMDLQRQGAHKMIDESKHIKIKRGVGDDKIILEDL